MCGDAMCLYACALLRTNLFSVTIARVVLTQIRTRCLINEIAFCLRGSILQSYRLGVLPLPLYGATSPPRSVWPGTPATLCPSLHPLRWADQALFVGGLRTQMSQQATAASRLVATEAAVLPACTGASRKWQEPARNLPSGEYLPEEHQ